MTLLKPLNLITLLSLAFIVILHLKKRQVKEVKVPSLMFWEEVIQEISQVKKIKINKYLLLIIQLLIASLIVFMFAEPVRLIKNGNNQYTIALDCSMSMKAIENGKSHLDMAKQKSIEYINSFPNNAKINIVVMSESTKILRQGISKKQFAEDIKNLKAEYKPLNLENAYKILNLCKSKVITFTDKEKLLGDKVIKVGNHIDDLAVVYANHDEQNNEAYCIVKNYGKNKKDYNISIQDENNKVIDIKKIHIENNQEQKVIFTKIPKGIQKINFYIQDKDMILENNKYVHYCGEQFKKRILLIGNNYFIEKVMRCIPYVKFDKTKQYSNETYKYDLYIIQDKKSINSLKDKNIWYLNPPKQFLNKTGKIEGKIYFEQNNFVQGIKNTEVYGEANNSLKKMKNYQNILSINKNSIMAYGYENKTKRIFSTVDWNKTSLIVTPYFPILIDNILKWTFGDLKANYKNYDYIVNDNFDKSNLRSVKLTNSKKGINNIVIIVILILLLIEWQVFKREY